MKKTTKPTVKTPRDVIATMIDIFLPLPNGVKIRKTPTGEISVIDYIRESTGARFPQATWTSISITYPEVSKLVRYFQFPGQGQRPTPVMGMDGYLRINHFLGGKVGEAFRIGSDTIVKAYLNGELERTDVNEDAAAALAFKKERRAEAKKSNIAVNATILKHGGGCFSKVAISTCIGATGKTPLQIRQTRGCKFAREGMSTNELTAIAMMEATVAGAIRNHNLQGDYAIVDKAAEIANGMQRFLEYHAGKEFAISDMPPPKSLTAPESPQLAFAAGF